MIMGQHLLIECKGEHATLNREALELLMSDAAKAAGATIIGSHFHTFGGHGGVTGVLMLAESHITVHTWPELEYAAFDIFMCGDAQPDKAAQVIASKFDSAEVSVQAIERGFSSSQTDIQASVEPYAIKSI